MESENFVEEQQQRSVVTEERRKSFVTKDRVLHYYTEDNEEIRIPVRAKTSVFLAAQEKEPMEALFYLLENIGAGSVVEKIKNLEVEETAEIVGMWSAEFEKRIQKAMNRRALSVGE